MSNADKMIKEQIKNHPAYKAAVLELKSSLKSDYAKQIVHRQLLHLDRTLGRMAVRLCVKEIPEIGSIANAHL
jgi:hypothetical protein